MAKGNFITTLVRGKMGNIVGYKNTNSKNKEKQAWRGYVASISNPKSQGQALQRLIMANLTRNYGTLKPIISRAFEGIKYGGQSYHHFLKLNIKNAGNGPYIPKGSRSTPLPIPGLILSEGSLISVAVDGVHNLMSGDVRSLSLLKTDLGCTIDTSGQATTWGAFCTNLISHNTDIRQGDQLTFIEVSVTENLEYIYRYKSVIIDTASTEQMTHVTGAAASALSVFGMSFVVENNLLQYSALLPLIDEVAVAGAVIQSRLGEDGTWLRSPSVVWVNMEDEEIAQYFSQEMFDLTLSSYMNGSALQTVDWPTQEDAQVTETFRKATAPCSVTIDETTQRVTVAAIVSTALSLKYITKTVDGVAYMTNIYGQVLTVDGIQVTAAMRAGADANIPTVDINDLYKYGL